jgi:predicted ester cyclase
MSTVEQVEQPPAEASNGELIRWAFGMLNKRDTAPLRRFWTNETVQRFPDRTCRGPDEIAAYFEEAFAALPDWHMEIVELVEHDEHVFVHWHLTGTLSGAPIQGIEPNGRRIELDGMDHFVMRDGKTVSNFIVFDQMQYARQIGLLPEDGSPSDKAMKAAFNAKTRLLERLGR